MAASRSRCCRTGRRCWRRRRSAAGGWVHYYVVRGDPGEADLTPCSDADRARVAGLLPTLRYVTRLDEVTPETVESAPPYDWGWLLVLALVALLGVELFLARRMLA